MLANFFYNKRTHLHYFSTMCILWVVTVRVENYGKSSINLYKMAECAIIVIGAIQLLSECNYF